jgi:hypothetical protein
MLLTDVCTNQQVTVPPGGNKCLSQQDAGSGSVWFADNCARQYVLAPPAAAMEALQLEYKNITATTAN